MSDFGFGVGIGYMLGFWVCVGVSGICFGYMPRQLAQLEKRDAEVLGVGSRGEDFGCLFRVRVCNR